MLASVAFCWAGFALFSAAGPAGSMLVAGTGVILFVYGVASAVLLLTVWLQPAPASTKWSLSLAAIPLVLWLVGSLDNGGISGHEVISTIGVVVLLGVQVLGIRVVNNAQQIHSADARSSRG